MLTYTSTADRYTVSGSSYTINFPYWKETEVKAVITLTDGTLQDLVLNTDYSVSTPNGNNGTLTKLTAWTDADKLTIYRDSAKTQEVDLVQGQKINADTIENSLDHSMAIMQEIQEKLSRTISSTIDEAGTDIEFPGKTARAGNLLGFDATGENVAFRSLAQFDNDVATTASNASAASASATLAQKWAENPEDTPVVTGSYSALHHANKAKASATSASTSATTATNKALDSEAWAVGQRNGTDVPPTDPTYHNSAKYYHDIITQIISGALRYQGTWTTTGATDYSAISTPRLKGDMFYCQGTAATIGGVTYTQGDLIIFNQDVASGVTILTSMIDKIDNTETVTPDNTCTLTNKTITYADNTLTGVQPTITGAATSVTTSDLTASKVLVSDASGKITASYVGSNKIASTPVGDIPVMNVGALDTGGFIKYCVTNGMCHVYFEKLYSTYTGLNQWIRVAGPLPYYKTAIVAPLTTGNQIRVSTYDSQAYMDLYQANTSKNEGWFCYPVSDSWSES